jgi:hypothetical protein
MIATRCGLAATALSLPPRSSLPRRSGERLNCATSVMILLDVALDALNLSPNAAPALLRPAFDRLLVLGSNPAMLDRIAQLDQGRF